MIPTNDVGRGAARALCLGGALAGKYNFLYCLGQNPAAEKNVGTSRFWVTFENSQNCRQIMGMCRRNIFHAPKSSQIPYTATIKKINNFINKIKNLLELRLVVEGDRRLPAGRAAEQPRARPSSWRLAFAAAPEHLILYASASRCKSLKIRLSL